MRTFTPERRRTSRIQIYSQAQKALFDFVQELQLPKDILAQCSKIMGEAWEHIPTIKDIPETALAIIYLVVRKNNILIPVKEFSKLSQVSLKSNAKKRMHAFLRIASQLADKFDLKTGRTSQREYTSYLIKLLNKSKLISDRLDNVKIWIDFYIDGLKFYALQLDNHLTPNIIKGRNPYNIASAVLCGADYLIGLYNQQKRGFITQIIIIRASELKQYAVRENYRAIVKPILQSREFESTLEIWRL